MNLKQLATKLRLSQTTVSRALNGYPEVSERTRARVSEAAQRYHYHPNPRAKSLATGRSMSIGHVIPISSKHEMVNPIFADFIAGAGEAYAREGYTMTLSVVNDAEEAAAYRALATKGAVDGIIVHGPREGDPRIALLKDIGLPFVVHGRAATGDNAYSYLDVNNARAFQRACEFLLDLGHLRIGLINGLENLDFALRRRSGYERALSARGITADPALMQSQEMTEAYGFRAASAMLDMAAPPSAFLVSSLIPSIGVRRAISDRGLIMGRDISVITHDDDLSYLRNGDGIPIFTATRSSVRAAGKRCAEMLLSAIQDPGQAPLQEIWEAELTLGASTGPALNVPAPARPAPANPGPANPSPGAK